MVYFFPIIDSFNFDLIFFSQCTLHFFGSKPRRDVKEDSFAVRPAGDLLACAPVIMVRPSAKPNSSTDTRIEVFICSENH